ncbi:ABC transporter permease [bacterium SCSIO 12741]|nr:ABC transporter permease [bacterium SCSIO 12741]
MVNVFRYCLFDLLRSRWSVVYTVFYLICASALLHFSNSPSNAVASLMNIVLFITPLVSMLLGIIYFYQNREFAELMLSQPIKRVHFFLGNYLGLNASMILSLLIGLGVPALVFGWNYIGQLGILLTSGILLSLIFSALALWISLQNENRIKGFGMAILTWLFFAIIYDGLFLILLLWFSDYPLENAALIATLFNPIDLGRVLILLQLDLSALLGFTGASFKHFLGSSVGIVVALMTAVLWVIVPLGILLRKGNRKDF